MQVALLFTKYSGEHKCGSVWTLAMGRLLFSVQNQRADDRAAGRGVCGSGPAAVNKWPPPRPPALR